MRMGIEIEIEIENMTVNSGPMLHIGWQVGQGRQIILTTS